VSFRAGVKGIIGKGELHGEIVKVFGDAGAIYLAAIGGLARCLANGLRRPTFLRSLSSDQRHCIGFACVIFRRS
jgi:hypothetical protein